MLSDKLRQAAKSVLAPPVGQISFTTPGIYTWTVPSRVTSICGVCIGAGGYGGVGPNASGGAGGGLSWRNDIPVTPGMVLTVCVPDTSSSNSDLVYGAYIGVNTLSTPGSIQYIRATNGGYGSGSQNTASYPGTRIETGSGKEGGGSGGAGSGIANGGAGGGAGAGGYAGSGGSTTKTIAYAGTGGGGGGGYNGAVPNGSRAPRGGGVGLYGQGADGYAGTIANGGSGGSGSGGSGGYYGAGGGGEKTSGAIYYDKRSPGFSGAVRIIWGPGRAFPSTLTTDQPVVS